MSKTLSFAGHRPGKLGGYAGDRATKIQQGIHERLLFVVERAYTNGFSTFISGGALGVDQIAARAVIEFMDSLEIKTEVELIIAKPFPSQGSNWPLYARDRFVELCKGAKAVINVSDDPYTSEKLQIRNEWMVNKSDAVIAVWNGGHSGTGNCVNYARSLYKPVLIINPYTLREKWEMNKKARW